MNREKVNSSNHIYLMMDSLCKDPSNPVHCIMGYMMSAVMESGGDFQLKVAHFVLDSCLSSVCVFTLYITVRN